MYLGEARQFFHENAGRVVCTLGLLAVAYFAALNQPEYPYYDTCAGQVIVVDQVEPLMPAAQASECFEKLGINGNLYPERTTLSSAAGDRR